jgi:exosortase
MIPSNRSRRDRTEKHHRRDSEQEARHKSDSGQSSIAALNPVIPADRNALMSLPHALIVGIVALLCAAFVWAYWATFVTLVQVWESEPDYSHGYFVMPIAAYFLWARRSTFPGIDRRHAIWPGIVLLTLAVSLRYVAAVFYLEPVDGWSLLVWFAGLAWLLGGWRYVRWALPSILFLFFMIPLPFRIERMLSYPLQRIAAIGSSWVLQCCGLAATAQGNTILMEKHTLEVEQACSGLTIFIGIAALAFAYVVLVRRSWWEKTLLILATLPIALIANSTRIVITGLLMENSSGEAAKKFSHDMAGWLMLPFAALLFALVLWYLGWLFPEEQQMNVRALVRSQAPQKPLPPRSS